MYPSSQGGASDIIPKEILEELELLKREKRRMDELITLKEKKADDQEGIIESLEKKLKKSEE